MPRGISTLATVAAALTIAALAAVVLVVTMPTACAASTAQQLHVQILAVVPHDPTMYTEGLEIHNGVLYEGSGLAGQSRLRATALASGAMLREATLPAGLFG